MKDYDIKGLLNNLISEIESNADKIAELDNEALKAICCNHSSWGKNNKYEALAEMVYTISHTTSFIRNISKDIAEEKV